MDSEGPKVPDGWVADHYNALTDEERGGDRPVECEECSWKGRESDVDILLHDIKDLADRLVPGGPVPYGLCPNWISDDSIVPSTFVCSCPVYHTDIQIAYRKMPDVLDRIVEACS